MSAAVIAIIFGLVLIGAELFSWLIPRSNYDKTTIIYLKKSPNQVKGLDVAYLIGLIAWKHIVPTFLGYSPPLKRSPENDQEFSLPEIKTEGLLDIDETHGAVFSDAVNQSMNGHGASGDVNAFFLVAQTVPIAIEFLANRNCPIKPFGAVNTKNTIRFDNPKLCRDLELLRTASHDGKLSYAAQFGGPENHGYRRKRGIEFQITITVLHESTAIMHQQLWFLQTLPKSFQPRYKGSADETPAQPDGSAVTFEQKISMSARDPQRWAASSKDYNPIHVSPLGAKLFGFRSVIAHGNHVAALAMQLTKDQRSSGAVADASQMFWTSDRAFELDVRFSRPVLLPAQLRAGFITKAAPEQVLVNISSDDKIRIELSLKWAQNA